MDNVNKLSLNTFSRLNANFQGVLWMILAGAAFAASNVSVRMAAEDMHPFVVVFFRSIIGVLLLAHVYLAKDFAWNPGPRLKLHILRGILQVTALLCLYTAVTTIPMATVIALAFITPLFTAGGAITFMGEPSKLNRWAAVIIGLCGALIIIRPGLITVSYGILLVLAYAVQQAASNLTAKKLIRHEPVSTVVAWMTLISTPLSLIPALFVWSWPDAWGWYFVTVNALCSTVAHIATTQAYRVADITIADPMIFFRLIAGAIFGYIFFSEIPGIWVWVGSAVIIFAATLLSRDKHVTGN
jgi:drug/metabolite transporter (DMT)-like permease